MGQGDPGRQHQAAGMKSRPKIGKTFHNVSIGENIGAHCCPEPIRRHVRSWRKQTLHRHRNMCEEGQRIAELEAQIDALQRQALALGRGANCRRSRFVVNPRM